MTDHLMTLLTTVVGGVLALAGGWWAGWRQAHAERRSLTRAFGGEIAALLAIAHARRYRENVEAIIRELFDELERLGASLVERLGRN